MRGVFDDDERQPGRSRDRILTLNPAVAMLLFFGLVAVCGLCFGLGYHMGSQNAEGPAAGAAQAAAAAPVATGNGHAKPSATAPNAPAPQHGAATPVPAGGGAPVVAVPAIGPSSTAGAAANPANQWVVKPALPQQGEQPAAYPQQAAAAKPQLGGAGSPMVQIAAVSQQEDADVLMSALRKRGYAVSAHRDPLDGLIHVQVGPFANRNDAMAMRQKLLNDGYNAMVQ